MAAGEQLTSSRLSEPQAAEIKTIADMIPAGLRAMSLTLTELDGAGGLIVPGQHIDVVAVFKKDTLGKDESMIMLQDVLVLAVAQATSAGVHSARWCRRISERSPTQSRPPPRKSWRRRSARPT